MGHIKEQYQNIREFITPELELLYSQIAGSNFMVAFANNDGVVLDTIYDNQFLNSQASKVVIPGSVWLEKYRGTNGLGLSLQTKNPTIVAGGEHFFTSHGGLSCFASPIFDHNQNIVGVIDASTDTSSRQDHTLALVKLSARAKSNVINLDDSTYASFATEDKSRSYTLMVMLTASHPKFKCQVCKQVDINFMLLANAYDQKVKNENIKRDIFFIRIDYASSSKTFQNYEIHSMVS